jgi:hypothetical protein
LARFAAMPPPMLPSPMNATRAIFSPSNLLQREKDTAAWQLAA